VEGGRSTDELHDLRPLLAASSNAISIVLQTWPGVLCLCSSDKGIPALVTVLAVDTEHQLIHNSLLALLFSIFGFTLPPWTADFAEVHRFYAEQKSMAAASSTAEGHSGTGSASPIRGGGSSSDGGGGGGDAAACNTEGLVGRWPNLLASQVALLLGSFCDAGKVTHFRTNQPHVPRSGHPPRVCCPRSVLI
jgi:hypothetical protein